MALVQRALFVYSSEGALVKLHHWLKSPEEVKTVQSEMRVDEDYFLSGLKVSEG